MRRKTVLIVGKCWYPVQPRIKLIFPNQHSDNHASMPLTPRAAGANRGIGNNLLKAFVEESWDVTATVRPKTRTEKDPTVVELEKAGVKLLELDYLDEATISRAAALYGADRPLDLLINVGGLSPHPKAWQEQTGEMMVEKFRVMAVGPILTIGHFLPSLELGDNTKIVNISSAFGSVSSE